MKEFLSKALTAALGCATRAHARVYGLACELHARRYFGGPEQLEPERDEPCPCCGEEWLADCDCCYQLCGNCAVDPYGNGTLVPGDLWGTRDPQDAAERAEPYVWDRDWTELD